ncbi:MAG TPA: hypothetical protein PLS29_05950 [Acidimicrobiales bacterium]|nr:MAG: hypothetical protein B7Z69_05050 [Actinobacteria bacterium 21-73-9]HQU26558.1 hypothetical protein [Acidimicrobiales bacterium]
MANGTGHDVDVETSAVTVPYDRARQIVLASQAVFFGALAVCVLLIHDHVAENDGISYYGVHAETIVLAVVGYVVASVGLWWFAGILRDEGVESTGWVSARVVSVMLILLLVTPFNKGAFLNWAHMTVGVIGALVQLGASWRIMRRRTTTLASVGFWVLLFGGVVAAASLPDWGFTHLLTGEIIFEVGYSLCVLEWARELVTSD